MGAAGRLTYDGEALSGVKLGLKVEIPIPTDDCQYYLFPGLLYNGNPTAEACHYFGEDFPEDASTVPGGFTVEDEDRVFGGWAQPQKNGGDPMISVRLQRNELGYGCEAVYLVPESIQFGRRLFLDSDGRLSLWEGWKLEKRFFLYASRKWSYTHLPNRNQGYGQVIRAAWGCLSRGSPTNPLHSLTRDYSLRLSALQDPYGLI